MENLDETAVSVFTDGSMHHRPRRGGIGFRIVTFSAKGEAQAEDYAPDGYPGGPINQMELRAIIAALDLLLSKRSPLNLSEYRKIVVLTDSLYVVENLTRARFEWSRNRWHNKAGKPVDNPEEWRDLLRPPDQAVSDTRRRSVAPRQEQP